MRIAVIGGGTAGIAMSWLLDRHHEVTLFERQDRLGGHVRTLGGNVPAEDLPDHLRLDAGVIEFEWCSFPLFRTLARQLDLGLREVPASTALFLDDGRVFRSPTNILQSGSSPTCRAREVMRDLPLRVARWTFHRRVARLGGHLLRPDRPLGRPPRARDTERMALI